ncbi:MAG: hypothetical protein JXA94_05070 [Parachlamydiales bacterium]|nr:hypothetical protein [Parachlamydiales bacterium]
MAIKPTTQNIDLEPSKWSTLNSVTPNFKKDPWYKTLLKVATFLLAVPLAVMIDLIKRSISYLKTEKKIVEIIKEDPPTRLQKVKNFVFDNKKKIFAVAALVGFGVLASKGFLKIPTGLIKTPENATVSASEGINQSQNQAQNPDQQQDFTTVPGTFEPSDSPAPQDIQSRIDVIYPDGTPSHLMI